MNSPSYLVVHLAVPAEDGDRIMGRLYDFGCLGLEELEESAGGGEEANVLVLKTYFENPGHHELFLKNLQSALADAAIRDVTTIGLGDLSFRPATYEPFPLVGRFEVAPPADLRPKSADRANAFDILIRPGPAFGTGRHETTRLVARALVLHQGRARSLLDVGTGSGILAVLAKKIGIADVTAVEIAPEAFQNANENFRLNACEDIALVDHISRVRGGFDLILGNLLAPTILHLKPAMDERLKPGGLLIVSGITVLEADDLESAFRDYRRLERNDTDEWACFTFQKV